MIELADIRRYAMALPGVVEQPHFRLPGFRVADRLLTHLERGDAHAIVCVGQAEAESAARDEPDVYEEVWRSGRIFVGLRVDLARVTHERMRELIAHAWRNRAPKRLVAQHDGRGDAHVATPA
ncbi:hypothetical protein [Micromonospora sp. URMC 103]|uniref:hypothetical protein n=1 Tax=Micromonospora sp. URMC 103 TaxID=3423406 RepID=UPI003F1BAD7F